MKFKLFAAVLAAVMAMAMVGCSNDEDESSSSSNAKTTITKTESKSSLESQKETDKADSEVSDSSLSESDSDSEDSLESDEASEISEESSKDNDEVVGETGLTVSEWCSEAQNIYSNAASMYFTYLCSSGGFNYDEADTIDDTWYRVTDFNTIEEASAEYYSVFAQAGHESDLDSQFKVVDDKLYRICGDRGSNISYQNSKVTELVDSSDSTLTFKVVSTYQYPEETEITTQEDTFTLVYERGVWRVGQFTMPY